MLVLLFLFYVIMLHFYLTVRLLLNLLSFPFHHFPYRFQNQVMHRIPYYIPIGYKVKGLHPVQGQEYIEFRADKTTSCVTGLQSISAPSTDKDR